jgi:cellulose synthase/poly-beta-1,6-N-acetylglucosamine synthase-like glycosyltransferase
MWAKANDRLDMKGKQSVSLVVPVLNEEATLPNMFAHLKSLDPPPHEIIFVDGRSSDRCSCLHPSCTQHAYATRVDRPSPK